MSGLDALVGQAQIDTPAEMEALGERIGAALGAGDVLVLTGALGAGKTTLVRGIARAMGVRGRVQSPTFVIARTHPPESGDTPLVHIDAYRLGSAAELDDLGIDVDGSALVIEWGREVVATIASSWWEVEIDREVGGRGQDTACGGPAAATIELDADAPRSVTIARRP